MAHHRCKIKNGIPTWKNEYMAGALRSYKGTSGGLAVQVAASKDSETAADTSALSGEFSNESPSRIPLESLSHIHKAEVGFMP